jgi:predicted lipoprotein with Yx(FWY)xxD motif
MTFKRSLTYIAPPATIALTALTLTACGSSGGAATASPPQSKTTSAPTKTATVRIGSSGLGSVLVDSHGRTLYLFKADSTTKSECSGACATAWPPLLAKGKPVAGRGLTASKLATITRSGGERQVTYNGHPLYLFVRDQKPGETTGQGLTAFGAGWFAVSPRGNQIATHSSSSQAAKPAPKHAAKPAPKPAAKPASQASNGIPQNNGGDGDADNNGGPSDGDGDL